MRRFPSEFRHALKAEATTSEWRLTRNTAEAVGLERNVAQGVLHKALLNPTTSQGQSCVMCWTYVLFEEVESKITEYLAESGACNPLPAGTSAAFPLSSVVKPTDSPCLVGYLLQAGEPAEQANAFWKFFSQRVGPELERMSSVECLADTTYVPPFTTRVKWGTRQMLWHSMCGRNTLALEIAREVERVAPVELTAGTRRIQSMAAITGSEFMMNATALDYESHPQWQEFQATRVRLPGFAQ